VHDTSAAAISVAVAQAQLEDMEGAAAGLEVDAHDASAQLPQAATAAEASAAAVNLRAPVTLRVHRYLCALPRCTCQPAEKEMSIEFESRHISRHISPSCSALHAVSAPLLENSW
jgi:hypothetical protein